MSNRFLRSGRLQKEIYVDGVIRKHNATCLSFLQYACPQQNMYVAVDRADVAFRPTCNLANRHRSLASHELEERPSFWRQRLPEQILRGE